MAQYIDIQFQEKATSQALNQRFLDITGPSILTGFRLTKGTADFTISLVRGGFNSSIAVTPSGAKVEETGDLFDILSVQPNISPSSVRVDSIYLRYSFGTFKAVGEYVVVEGTTIPAENPNKLTHLLLGYVYVQPNNEPIKPSNLISTPYGFSDLEVAGTSLFHGPVNFDKPVVFNSDVTFNGNTGTGGGSASPSFIERLKAPIIATEGQTDVTLPSTYTMNTQTLFVYKNGDLVPPSEWMEVTTSSFRFFTPLEEGDKVWAFWYKGINVYSIPTHNHDDLYYRKYEIANRSVRYATDYFAGPTGRSIKHHLGTDNYIIVSVTPIEKTSDVGTISTEKRANEILVYNTGSYRGRFDICYVLKPPFPEISTNYQLGDLTTESSDWNTVANVYTTVNYRKRTGILHMRTTMFSPDAKGRLTRMRIETFNDDGTKVIETKVWAFTYDENDLIKLKTRVE